MKTYKGVRRSGGSVEVFVIEHIPGGDGLQRQGRLEHRLRHSPDGFEWGYHGSGPADLAFSILWDCLDQELADLWYMDFKWDVVSKFDQAEWSITSQQIEEWLRARADAMEVIQ